MSIATATAATDPRLSFTYLDLVDPTVEFKPVMATGGLCKFSIEETPGEIETIEYSIFDNTSTPGYEGKRCIIEQEMALALKNVQNSLRETGPYTLRVYDAYRPTQAVDSSQIWAQQEENPIVKRFHHPNLEKKGLHDLVYISRRSPHSMGLAVDLTIAFTEPSMYDFTQHRPKDFIGIFNPDEIDVGNVGFLAFDQRSCHYYTELTPKQTANRKLLLDHMLGKGFEKLGLEFWHYFYKRERNSTYAYNFPIKDDYLINEDGVIVF